jgi:hypothetical protein
MPKILLALVLACATSALFAQPSSSDARAPKRERRFDCSKAKDPQACEERLAKARAAHAKARQACQGKKGDEGRECMRREMCAQTKDPAKCEAQVKEHAALRAKVREACKGKQGEELRACVREQREKK